jgi:hypothetical protein
MEYFIMNNANSKIALLKLGNTRVEDSFNRPCKIDREKHNEKDKTSRYIVSCVTVPWSS